MQIFHEFRVLVIASIVLIGLLAGTRSATAETFVPTYHPTMEISKRTGDIKIDGILDDPGWKGVAIADNFSEHNPGDQVKPPVDTRIFMTYDESHIYLAFIAYDDPSEVRASLCKRDNIHHDDNIGFFVDTYGDATWAYTMNVNPYGIQYDALWSNGHGEDSGYDLIWESKGVETDSGWQAEIAIPFSSLRFPDKEEQTWRVDFWRNHPRESDRQYSWAAYDRDEACWPCKWGTITGIKGVKPGQGLELLPSVIAFQSAQRNDIDEMVNGDPDGEVALAAKYAVSSDITAEITYNPDFSQIEADASQIDVNNTTALSYAERRPFFQEGSDLFRTLFFAVYTRSINDPQVAAKVTGRLGKTSFAYLGARDEHTPIIMPLEQKSAFVQAGKSFTNLFRIRQTVAENSHLGLLMTDRRLDDDGSNTLIGFDGSLRLSKNYSVIWQVLGTHSAEPNDTAMTQGVINYLDYYGYDRSFDDSAHTVHYDGESYWGDAAYFGIERSGRHFNFDLAYLQKSPTFRADNGYQPTNDRRKTQALAGYTQNWGESILERFSSSLTVGREWNYRSDINEEYLWLDAHLSWRKFATGQSARYERYNKRFAGNQFNDIWRIRVQSNSSFSDMLEAGISYNYGHQIAYDYLVMGKETQTNIWLDVRPTDRFLIENWFDFASSYSVDNDARLFSGYVARSRLNYQFSRELSIRMVVQYDDFDRAWDLDPLLTYQINPFSVLYAGSSHGYHEYGIHNGFDAANRPITEPRWRLDSRQFFLKLKYLFQI